MSVPLTPAHETCIAPQSSIRYCSVPLTVYTWRVFVIATVFDDRACLSLIYFA